MPEKTVREMSRLERARHSLANRVFHSTIFGSIILGLTAMAIGLGLYTYALAGQHIREATILSRTAAMTVDRMSIAPVMIERVMDVYRGLSEEERAQTGTEEYRLRFSRVSAANAYHKLRAALLAFQSESGSNAVYLGVYDRETSALVYVCDPNCSEETGFFPGEWEPLETRELNKFLNWDGQGRLYDISRTGKYGWMCTAGEPLKDDAEETIGFILVDVTLRDVVTGMRSFTLQYVITIAALIILFAALLTRRMKKTVVTPINDMAEAARCYVRDRRSGRTGADHFSRLDIHTGDEVENLSLIMADMERGLTEYEDDLMKATAERERIGTELALASRIQSEMLPSVFPPFPDRTDFDIYASMKPAKEVGGDFYDFFLLDRDRLGLVMADVSGKGVPAALFMMVSKILTKNFAAMGESPGRVLEMLNDQICSNNREEMFITVWLGVLDLKTGRLLAANAGHEYPALKKPDGSFELVKDRHGFVVGGMEDMHYKEYELQMDPGSKLFVYTDGVPEAADENNELFGTDRMLTALRRAENASPGEILRSVDEAVSAFVGRAPQFDDQTMMCVYYAGQTAEEGRPMKELTLEAKTENIETVTDFVNAELEAVDCPLKTRMQIDTAIDEVFANIASYAYGGGSGEAVVRLELEEDPRAVVLSFADRGVPFDPLAKEDPDVSLSAEERPIGGLGIFLVKNIMDDVSYEYRDGQNILRIKKRI